MLTQSDDIQEELLDAGYSDAQIPYRLRNRLTALIAKAYNKTVDVSRYNKRIKKMAKDRIIKQMKDAGEIDAYNIYTCLVRDREELLKKNKDLQGKDLGDFLDAARKLLEVTHGCRFTLPDGFVVDQREYVKETMTLRSAFHGSISSPQTHTNALDLRALLKATPPDIIHSIDGLILRYAYTDAPYEVVTIHDSCGSHPNNFDDMCLRYRQGFLKATEGEFLADIAKQWGVDNLLVRDENADLSWRDQVLDSKYLFH